ncbi:MAG: hypothetical protein Tsb0019_34580 [Roseibium sp.]
MTRQEIDRRIQFPGGHEEEKNLKHRNPQRQWVCIEQKGDEDAFKAPEDVDPGDNRSSAPEPGYRKFRQFDDAAIDAILEMATISETRLTSLSSQRIQVTLVNTAICAGVFTFLADTQVNLDALSTERFSVLAILSLLAAFGFGGAFWLMVKTIGATEIYYFHLVSDSFYCASRHYRAKAPISNAKKEYLRNMGSLKPILEQHTHRVFELINLFAPVCTWLVLILLISTHQPTVK